jgi:SH3 domain protein
MLMRNGVKFFLSIYLVTSKSMAFRSSLSYDLDRFILMTYRFYSKLSCLEGLKNMHRFELILIIALGLCLISQPSWAEKAYVIDSLKITLRTGPSLENRVIANLSSGQPVEVLDLQGDWSQVRLLENGERSEEGWVLSRYLITRQPWKMRANALIKENVQLKKTLTALENKSSEAVRREQELATRLQKTAMSLNKVEKEHQSLKNRSADYLKLEAKYKATQSKLTTIQREFEGITEKYKRLRSSQRNKWYMTGAGVLLSGLIVGLVLGRQQRKRRSSYDF